MRRLHKGIILSVQDITSSICREFQIVKLKSLHKGFGIQDEEVSPPEKGTMAVHGDKGMSPANPKTPVASNRSSDSGSAHIARSSPSLMTQAARLAASFGQVAIEASSFCSKVVSN